MSESTTQYESTGWTATHLEALNRRLHGLASLLNALIRNPKGLAGLVILTVVVVVTVGAPLFAPYAPDAIGVGGVLKPPTGTHPFGTDDFGHDVFSRFLYGGRISLLVGVVSGLVATVFATLLGIPAGYYKGRAGRWLTTVIDMSLVFPPFLLVIVFAAYIGSSVLNIIIILSLLSWPIPARTIKAKTLSVRENEFVESTTALGATDVTVMKDEVLPSVLPVIFANGVLQVVYTILMEAAVSFLGLGDPSTVSWGSMLYFAQKQGALSVGAWWWLVFPGLGIIVTAFGFTLLGTALDEVLNPRLQRRTWGWD